MLPRFFRHLFTPYWILKLRFKVPLLAEVERRIHDVERAHPGELRFVVEHALELGDLLCRLTPRERALELFGLLRVWDTEHNSGILIYVLHAEHAVEIVADRGIAGRVPQADWDELCQVMEKEFRAGRYGEGALAGVNGAAALLEKHFPPHQAGRNELPNQPLLL
jgi:uncharacterized membrane protein